VVRARVYEETKAVFFNQECWLMHLLKPANLWHRSISATAAWSIEDWARLQAGARHR